MTLQAYQVALADLRHWHEGDRFQKHFDEIEAHVNALGTLTEVKSLPAPTSILLTRNAEGRLCNPATGEPFTIVIDTIDGRKEVTSIWFKGERDAPFDAAPSATVDSEQPAGNPPTIDGIPVVTDDTLLPPDADAPLITLGTFGDLGAVPDDADEADEGSDVPPDPPKPKSRKKVGS